MVFYIETSALNHFRTVLTDDDALATRGLQRDQGRHWVWSPVTVWEVLLTRQLQRKEELISLAQNLLAKELLPSPEELLVKYLEQGCPLIETPRPLISESALAGTWKDLHANSAKTFVVDDLLLRTKVRSLAQVMKDLHRLIRNRTVVLAPYTSESLYDITLEGLLKSLSFLKHTQPDDYQRRLYKIAIFYLFVLLCAGGGIHPEGIAQFWESRKIPKVVDRLKYILNHHETIVYQGPLAQMAMMTELQCSNSYSRGMFWDSMHAFYLSYVSVFFSEDRHFTELREQLGNHPNGKRILKPSNLSWVRNTRPIQRQFFILG